MKKPLRKASKRMPAKRRYKIAKKVREHKRRLRKEAKKTGHKKEGRKSREAKARIPNSAPFKDEVLAEAERLKRKAEEERERKREALKEQRRLAREAILAAKRGLPPPTADVEMDEEGAPTDPPEIQKILDEANVREEAFRKERELEEFKVSRTALPDTSAKSFYKEFKKVVESSDVVLEVLDARDPLGCRSKELEEAVLETKGQKRLVLVLNKADLVPRANLKAWLEYLRKEFPTVAFKAATAQNQVYRSRKQVMKASLGLLNSTQCLGADMVMSLLGNYCRNKGIRTSITVGVVGFPNVGKSSLINSLKRNKSCNVGAVPGVTRTTQLVQLDKHIRLLDSPGMVLAASSSNLSAAALALRNAVRVEAIEDPITPVEAILERATKQQLMIHYKLPAFNTVDEFLGLLARRSGYLRKGGIADPERAARSVLLHWNSGKIKYFTEPPSKPLVHVEASLVSEMAKEFDLEAVDAMSTEMLEKKLPRVLPSETLKVDAQTVVTKLDGGGEEAEMQGEDQPMEDEEDNDGSFSTARTKSIHGLLPEKVQVRLEEKVAKREVRRREKEAPLDDSVEGNQQLNKASKAEFKKGKKGRAKQEKRIAKLADHMVESLAGLGSSLPKDKSMDSATKGADDSYDFESDFGLPTR